MAHNVLNRLAVQHLLVEVDLVVELFISILNEVVNQSNLWRGKLDHQLGGHRGHQAPGKRQLR